jgi:hypothetical protein
MTTTERKNTCNNQTVPGREGGGRMMVAATNDGRQRRRMADDEGQRMGRGGARCNEEAIGLHLLSSRR